MEMNCGMCSSIWWAVIIIAIMLLYCNSKVYRFYAKFGVFLVLSMISATVFIPIMVFRPFDYRNALYFLCDNRMPAWGARQISWLLGLEWEMKGKENIVQDEGCLVLINHQSGLDLLVLAEIWPVLQRCTVISKREIFYLWPFGLATWLWGTVFINRFSGKDAQETVNKAAQTIRTRRAKICMFPEGTRHGGPELLPFKKGAFHVAIASQAPIQPVVVSRYTFLDFNTYRFDSGKNVISILPAIRTQGLTKEDLESLMERTYQAMSAEYHKLSSVS